MICRAIPYEGNDPYIFVSFCHLDCAALYPVFEQMVMDGYRFWYDNADCTGDVWLDNMENHLENCKVVIAFVSENSSMSHKCRSEITYAIKCRKKVVPILIDHAALPKGMRMQLNSLQCMNKEPSFSWRTLLDSVYECEECRACRVPDGSLALMPLPKETPKVIPFPTQENTQSFWKGLSTAQPIQETASHVNPIPDIPLSEDTPEIQKPVEEPSIPEEVIPEVSEPVNEVIEEPSVSEEAAPDVQEPVEEVEEPSIPEEIIPEVSEPVNEIIEEPSVSEEAAPDVQEPVVEVEEPSIPEEIIPEVSEPVKEEIEEPIVPEEVTPEIQEPLGEEIQEPVVPENNTPDILIPTEPVAISQTEDPNASESDDDATSRLLNTNLAILLRLSTRRAYMLRKSHSKIGRSLIKCDIPIVGNASVSNYHADIFQEQNAVYLQDAGSVNGTFCNGQRLESEKPITLENPAVFRLSNETLVLLSGSLARQYERAKHVSFVVNEAHTALKLLDEDTLYLNRNNCWPDMTLADSKIHHNAHAKISCEEDGCHLINEAPFKGNGTYLNERKLNHQESALLCSGDRIRLGNTTLEYFSISF